MKYTVHDSVRIIMGVGEVVEESLERLGIAKISDLLRWYPRNYLDASRPSLVDEVEFDKLICLKLTIEKINLHRTKNRNIPMLEVTGIDGSGEIKIRWFNQPFLKQKLKPGSTWIFIGTVNRFQGKLVMMSPLIEESPQILAIYAQTKGLTSKMLRGYVGWVFNQVEEGQGIIPLEIEKNEGLVPYWAALRSLHQPKILEEIEQARYRMKFEEAFSFFTRMMLNNQQAKQESGLVIEKKIDYVKKIIEKLPFELTNGQKRAIWDALQDMNSGHSMTRLLNGDVGSGKTVVAAVLSALVAVSGYQVVFLVPTEILAKQHKDSISKLLGIEVALWTAAQKDPIEQSSIVVGTHAVLHDQNLFSNLGLIIIDEQHRFGVRQRQLLRSSQDFFPHVLSMTATPIPRTLALVLYGDLSVSVLPEKPKDRLPVITTLISNSNRSSMQERIKKEIDSGNQIFIICSLIEEKKSKVAVDEGEQLVFLNPEELEKKEKKTVLAELEKLQKEHPEYGVIEAIHGKMKAEKKREIMQRMQEGKIQVLVATSVIEVGVDIPKATVIVIEGAESFGLAQLHQFRGRVGRGKDQAYCFLCPTRRGEQVDQRLQALVKNDSGFEIAEVDLKLRGPGELVGNVQSGLPDFRMATLTDIDFLSHVKKVVEDYYQKNPEHLEKTRERAYSTNDISLE